MRLPKAKRPTQPRLWDFPILSHAYARNAIGDICETLGAVLFNAERLTTDSRCEYCPDLLKRGRGFDTFIECKGSGLSRQTFIYEGRLKKDADFAAGHKLVYAVFEHQLATKSCKTEGELRAGFLRMLKSIWLVPFEEIYSLAMTLPCEKLNSKYYGHAQDQPDTYGSGYRLPIKALAGLVHERIEWRYDRQFSLFARS